VLLLRNDLLHRSLHVHAYCLMPDPFHFLAEGIEPTSDLFHAVKILKIKSSRQYAANREASWGKTNFTTMFFAHWSPLNPSPGTSG
jgi:REP element-mobilizing transposase RayT